MNLLDVINFSILVIIKIFKFMIISKTPYRISFFGGGTDMPKWYLKNDGQVLSTSIDKYVYLTCRELSDLFKEKIRLVYSKTELINNVNDIQHPSLRETLKFMNVTSNIDIHYDGDLPAFSGLGSSSAFTVGLVNALSLYKKKKLSQKNIALKSIQIEQKKVKENVGSQDQVAVSIGGLNHIYFNKNGSIKINKIKLNYNVLKKFQNNLMLFYTGIKRNSNDIQKNYIRNIFKKNNELKILHSSVDKGIKYLNEGSIDDFGYLMNEMWEYKKKLNEMVSNDFIDKTYKQAVVSGALGGKIIGAGGGGFFLFYVKKNDQPRVREALKKLKEVSFNFDNHGTKIIYNER